MPVRQRKPNDIAQQVVPLLLLGIGLVTTNNSVTFIDDEALILGAAASSILGAPATCDSLASLALPDATITSA
jgi:hypothetical protein